MCAQLWWSKCEKTRVLLALSRRLSFDPILLAMPLDLDRRMIPHNKMARHPFKISWGMLSRSGAQSVRSDMAHSPQPKSYPGHRRRSDPLANLDLPRPTHRKKSRGLSTRVDVGHRGETDRA